MSLRIFLSGEKGLLKKSTAVAQSVRTFLSSCTKQNFALNLGAPAGPDQARPFGQFAVMFPFYPARPSTATCLNTALFHIMGTKSCQESGRTRDHETESLILAIGFAARDHFSRM